MSKMTMKELRSAAEAFVADKITNREKLEAALPVLIDLQNSIAFSRKTLKAAGEAARKLAVLCTKYAVAHESTFDDRCMHLSQNGVRSGNITVDGTTYHLACGYSGYIRADGENFSQEFFGRLPEGWVKSKLELDVTKISDSDPSNEELDAAGLRQKPHDEWSVLESV